VQGSELLHPANPAKNLVQLVKISDFRRQKNHSRPLEEGAPLLATVKSWFIGC
jgi:hypothetical protein